MFEGDVKEDYSNWLVVEPYPSEKYEFINWDDDIPNIWINNEQRKCSKPPTSTKYGLMTGYFHFGDLNGPCSNSPGFKQGSHLETTTAPGSARLPDLEMVPMNFIPDGTSRGAPNQ